MKRRDIIRLVVDIIGDERPFDALERCFASLSKGELKLQLLECAIIPESLAHDSSEEKLWSKYCDILLAHAWSYVGIPSEVLRARGDSADVFGRADGYTVVGDAKAFRLSRTAKNQKDFKIKALDDWRKGNTYACLVSPLYQYPQRSSQIYDQAVAHNVTLLSYTHLRFLLDHVKGQNLLPLWEVGRQLKRGKTAELYWSAVDETVTSVVSRRPRDLEKYKAEEVSKTKEIGAEGIEFWQKRIESYRGLSQREAVMRLIKAEKIESKIQTIRNAVESLPGV